MLLKVFEKMLNVGVPEQAVRLKMQSQGLDDHLLDSFILTKKMWMKYVKLSDMKLTIAFYYAFHILLGL